MISTLPSERWFEALARHDPPRSMPWVTVAYAQSLDGSISAVRGQPLGLSSPESLQITHRVRAAHDAILVGIGTVLADDPRLTVRGVDGPQPQPVILDSYLRIPEAAQVLKHPKPPWIAALTGVPENLKERLAARKAMVLEFNPDMQNLIPLDTLLRNLRQRGIRRLLVEGGAKVISRFLSLGQVDGVFITIAPVFLGGLSVLDGRMMRKLQEVTVDRCGEDILVWGKLA